MDWFRCLSMKECQQQSGFYTVSDYTLLTGSTGLLGRYLLRDLLLAGQRVAIVARSTEKENVSERIESFLQPWESELGVSLPRPVCFEGDICQEFLGLDEISRKWIAENCSSMLHSAAALKFHEEEDGEPWRTNVGGTRHVLQLCRDTGIKEMHYVSTAYVCGTRSDHIMETDLDLGQSFRNDYEKSKLEAEMLVREECQLEKVTVYRPAVIAGDSRTGYTNTYHGLYMYLKIMCILARNTEPGPDGVRYTPMQLDTTGDEPRNVIPVDWTSAVIAHLFTTRESHGRTFHLAPQVCMTARQMVEAGYSYFNSTGVEFVGRSGERSSERLEQDFYENATMYRPYEDSDPEFDTTNLEMFAGHLPCPVIDEVMLHRFMKYGEEDRWGKRRQKRAEIPFDIYGFLEEIVDTESRSTEETLVGLNILGAGGGQWTVVLGDNNCLTAIEQGIDFSAAAVWETSSKEFADCAQGVSPISLNNLADQLVLEQGKSKDSVAKAIMASFFLLTSKAHSGTGGNYRESTKESEGEN